MDEIQKTKPSKYWAAEKDLPKVVAKLEDLVRKYYEWAQSSGMLGLWRNMHKQSYSGIQTQGMMRRAGDNLEYTTIKVNHFGNLKQHVLTMVTGQRQYFESKAANTDHRSQAQTLIANSLCETVMREKDLETVSQQTCDYALQAGEGFTLKQWDWEAGPDVAIAPDDEQMPDAAELKTRKAGDIKYTALHPLDVARDVLRDSHALQDWYIIRTYQNRYDLAAKYKKLKDQIVKAPSVVEMETTCPRLATGSQFANWECDLVPVWLFIHRKTPALPQGRMIAFISKEAALYDQPMLHRELPLYRLSAQDVAQQPLGYSSLYDLAALQQAFNATASTITSNLAAFGVQNVWVPEGSKLTVEQLKGGLKMISGGQVKPEGLNLFALPPEVIKFLELLERWLETLSGINSVSRGNPEASLKSGSALALVQAQALQFLALIQKAYVKFLENVASGTVFDFQDFGEVPHIITVTGKANRQYVAEFTSANIDKISRVQIQVGNPLSGTIAGRVNMIEQMGQLGLIKTPEQYFQVLQTGRLEAATEATMSELMLIKAENEALTEGGYTQAIILENHPLHMREHASVLSSPEVRTDPDVVNAVLQHLQEHIVLWKQADPQLLAIIGVPPADLGMQLQQMQIGQQAQQGGGAPGGMMPPGPSGAPPAPGNMPNQPQMPQDPMTGGRAQAPQPVNPAPSAAPM